MNEVERILARKPPAQVEGQLPLSPLDELAREIHATAAAKGFWDHRDGNPSIYGEKLALVHSEVSEALEALRDNDLDGFAEELADVIIRVLDLADAHGLSMDDAVARKMAKNADRPHLHGRKW